MFKTKMSKGELEDEFLNASRYRLSIPRDTKGFLHPIYDLIVKVEDKPGVIASISTALSRVDINIKDIEILKVKEGDAGTLRLSLESDDLRKQAQDILDEIGYQQ